MPIDDNCGRQGGGTQKHSVPACLSEEVHKELMHKTTLTRRLIAVSNQGLTEDAIDEIGAVKPAVRASVQQELLHKTALELEVLRSTHRDLLSSLRELEAAHHSLGLQKVEQASLFEAQLAELKRCSAAELGKCQTELASCRAKLEKRERELEHKDLELLTLRSQIQQRTSGEYQSADRREGQNQIHARQQRRELAHMQKRLETALAEGQRLKTNASASVQQIHNLSKDLFHTKKQLAVSEKALADSVQARHQLDAVRQKLEAQLQVALASELTLRPEIPMFRDIGTSSRQWPPNQQQAHAKVAGSCDVVVTRDLTVARGTAASALESPPRLPPDTDTQRSDAAQWEPVTCQETMSPDKVEAVTSAKPEPVFLLPSAPNATPKTLHVKPVVPGQKLSGTAPGFWPAGPP